MAEREIVGWFTRNGKRIPIFKGEGKIKAVKKYLKNKEMQKLGKRNEEWRNKFDEYARKWEKQYKLEGEYKGGIYDEDEIREMAAESADEDAEEYMVNKYGKNWYNPNKDTTIRGRAETKAEYNKYSKAKHEFINKYMDKSDEASVGYVNNALANLREHNKYYAKGREIQGKTYKLTGEMIKHPPVKGYKLEDPTPNWNNKKNKEIEVTFWRGNPQLQNGGYEMKRNYTARTESGLMKQVRKTENAPVYGSMTYLSHKQKKTYRIKKNKNK